jgi:flagellar hook-associated protein 1 FlgK
LKTLFEISKSGLAAAQRALTVTSNNVVNANTKGYTRQRVDTTPAGYMQGNLNVGLGVNISTAARLRNNMNDMLTNQKRQDLSSMNYKNQVFERLQASMTTGSGGDLDVRVSRLFDMFSELSTDPQDMSVRNSLLSEAQQLTAKFRNIDETITNTSELVRESAINTLEEINTLLVDIFSLNQAVASSSSQGSPDAASLDLRVQKLEELSKLVNFEQDTTDSGDVEIRIGGITVLDKEGPETLQSDYSRADNQFRVRLDNGKLLSATKGELGSQLELVTEIIPEMRAKIDLLAKTIVDETNAIHSSGFGLRDNAMRNFFNPTGVTAGTISVNTDLVGEVGNIAASSVLGEAGNGQLAAQIADLRNEALAEGRKLVDFTIDAISTPGAAINSLNAQIETTEAEIAMLETQQQRQAGVNIDEELALMIQYQNAYQGAARVMSTAQEMYDTLLGIIR